MSDEAKERAIREAIEAIKCAERGEPHPRLYSYMRSGLKERARRAQARKPAAMPPQQEHKPEQPIELDWETRSIGPGGAMRND